MRVDRTYNIALVKELQCGLKYCAERSVRERINEMLDIGIILKVAGVGILVSAAAQILSKSGRDEQSMLVTIAGIIVVLIMLIGEIEKLFELVCSVFGF